MRAPGTPGFRWGPVAAAVLAAAALPARAGLFDDDEARKAILDLRQRIAAVDEKASGSASDVSSLRGTLLELNNQIESMRQEIARLRGSNEELVRNVAELQRRQQDASQGLDDRLRRLEPAKVSLDGRDFLAQPAEKQAYDDAVGVLRNGDFGKAGAMLDDFLQRWPTSGYAPSARFWLGNAQYAQRQYREAVDTLRAFVAGSPEHPRAPEALLALANAQAEMKDPKSARLTIAQLVKSYPSSDAAKAGKERLASLK